MGFVDGEQGKLRAFEQRQRPLLQQPLRRDIEEIELARGDPAFECRLLAIVKRGIQERGPDADLGQRLHLVLHECDERRDDDAGAGPYESGDLIAQRLAAARRHQRQGITTGDHGGDDVCLMRAKFAKAEYVGQHLARAIERGGRINDLARRGGRHRPLATLLPNLALGSAIRGCDHRVCRALARKRRAKSTQNAMTMRASGVSSTAITVVASRPPSATSEALLGFPAS